MYWVSRQGGELPAGLHDPGQHHSVPFLVHDTGQGHADAQQVGAVHMVFIQEALQLSGHIAEVLI